MTHTILLAQRGHQLYQVSDEFGCFSKFTPYSKDKVVTIEGHPSAEQVQAYFSYGLLPRFAAASSDK
jgi:predicted NAD-dependent protein-ADP-ribosyltransferase YbiA (DUF1768 family)